MKRRIEQLVNGRYSYRAPRLIINNREIQIEVQEGGSQKGEFFFSCADNSRIKCTLVSSDRRIVLEKDNFSGNAIHVRFIVDARGLTAGALHKGTITILSPVEEAEVSIDIHVVTAESVTTAKGAKTLDGFAKLAAAEYREAFRFFCDPSFQNLLKGKDSCFKGLYKGLSVNPVTYQHLEEFLIATGRKEQVMLSLDREQKQYDSVRRSLKDVLYINKNTWGYTRMEIDITGDFLQVDKKVVTSEDFIGSVYGLEYVIRRDRLKKGKNYGRITISTVYETLVYEVVASSESGKNPAVISQKERLVELYKDYLDYDCGLITAADWRHRTEHLLETEECSRQPLWQIYRAFMYAQNNDSARTMTAGHALTHLFFLDDQAALDGLSLYVRKEIGLLEDDSVSIRDRIYDLRMMDPLDPILLRIWLKESDRYSRAQCLREMEKLMTMGCNSPILFSGAWRILKDEPDLLQRFTPFTLSVLEFAVRRGILTGPIRTKLALLAQHERGFSSRLYRLLVKTYEACQDKEILAAVITMIMLEKPDRPCYFPWYQKAVDQEIRMTRLYEYYIETLDGSLQEVFPQVVRLYFSYENRLASSKKAMVYANVIRNREKDRVTYENYSEAMSRFAWENLKKGKINEDYACIYREFIPQIKDPETANAMADLVFTHKVTVRDRNMRRLIVVSPYLEAEEGYLLKDGITYIRKYSEDDQIIFEDAKKRRFAATVDYKIKALFPYKQYREQLKGTSLSHTGILIREDLMRMDQCSVGEENLERYLYVIRTDIFNARTRVDAGIKVLEYYARHDDEELPDTLQRLLLLDSFAGANKALVVKVMLQRGKLAGAFDLICRYGFEDIDSRTLASLCTRLIESMEYGENEELIYLAQELFLRKKANDVILTYLADQYIGPLEMMTAIRDLMADRELNTYDMDEELLSLSMYVRKPLKHPGEIFSGYVSRDSHSKKLAEAFLTFCAFRMFMENEPQEEPIAERLILLTEENEACNPVCRLALIRYYNRLLEDHSSVFDPHETKEPPEDRLSELQRKNLTDQLEWLNSRGIRFSFYQKLPQAIIAPYQLEDRIFVEKKADPAMKLKICYRTVSEFCQDEPYRQEPMREMFQGFYGKEFLLFYGETLEYYLTWTEDEETKSTPVRQLSVEQTELTGETRYHLINRMLAGLYQGEYEETDRLMIRYLEQEQRAKAMLPLL